MAYYWKKNLKKSPRGLVWKLHSFKWLDWPYEKRYNLVYRSLLEESSSVGEATIKEGRRIYQIWPKDRSKRMYSMQRRPDWHFFNLLPDKSYIANGRNTVTQWHCLNCVLLFYCAVILKEVRSWGLLLLESCATLDALKNMKFSYKVQSKQKSVDNTSPFLRHFTNTKEKMKLQNCKIILFMDQCSAHPDLQHLMCVLNLFLQIVALWSQYYLIFQVF